MHKCFETYPHETPDTIDSIILLQALELVLKRNAFAFGDTTWLQKSETAMGMPCACTVAVVYYSYHEQIVLLSEYGNDMKAFSWFIDDGLGVWLATQQ